MDKNIDFYVNMIMKDQNKCPIDLDRVLKFFNIELVEADLSKKNLSGFAYKKSDKSIIAVDKNEKESRKRFTIAHELGHLLLHSADSSLNYDKRNEAVLLFRKNSIDFSDLYDKKEKEANRFAAELLMPKKQIIEDLKEAEERNIFFDIFDDDFTGFIEKMAKKYKVSFQAMSIRINSIIR